MTLNVDAVVRQISTNGRTYVNILSGLDEGGIGIWSNAFNRPTYLLIAGNNWVILTFDDEAWRDEHLPGLVQNWVADEVYTLPSMERIQI